MPLARAPTFFTAAFATCLAALLTRLRRARFGRKALTAYAAPARIAVSSGAPPTEASDRGAVNDVPKGPLSSEPSPPDPPPRTTIRAAGGGGSDAGTDDTKAGSCPPGPSSASCALEPSSATMPIGGRSVTVSDADDARDIERRQENHEGKQHGGSSSDEPASKSPAARDARGVADEAPPNLARAPGQEESTAVGSVTKAAVPTPSAHAVGDDLRPATASSLPVAVVIYVTLLCLLAVDRLSVVAFSVLFLSVAFLSHALTGNAAVHKRATTRGALGT